MDQQFPTTSSGVEEPQKQSIWKKQIMSPGTASIVFGVLSLLFFPLFFGLLAVASGGTAWKKGGSEKRKGIIGIILGILGLSFWIFRDLIFEALGT